MISDWRSEILRNVSDWRNEVLRNVSDWRSEVLRNVSDWRNEVLRNVLMLYIPQNTSGYLLTLLLTQIVLNHEMERACHFNNRHTIRHCQSN